MKKIIISILRDCGYSLNWRQDRTKVYFGLSFTTFFVLACSSASLIIIGLALANTAFSVYLLNNQK